jgi:hypothetical protein
VPQFSFMNAVVHGEAMTRLFGAAASLVAVAGIVGAIRRPVMWVALALLVAATPLIDRQGFFVAAFAGAAIVIAEPTWRRRGVVLALLLVPALLVPPFIARYNEWGNLGPWFQLLRHPIRPLLYADPASGANDPPQLTYYVFEFFPKLFLSFWAWLGQPSILMAPLIYAALAVLTIVGAAGAVFVLATGRSALIGPHLERLRALRALGFGVAAMCLPIAYGPALAGRNLWFGRWLFPMIGAIVVLLGVGWAAVLERPHRRRAAAVALAIIGVAAAAVWMLPAGAAFRAAIEQYHYGDRPHLVLVARDFIVASLVGAAGLAVAVRSDRVASVVRDMRTPAAAAVLLNLVIVFTLVRPLYARLEPGDFVAMIRRDVSAGRSSRAADTYASAVKIYPDSPALRGLAGEMPRLLISPRLDEMSGMLQEQLARGATLEDRDTLLALARYVRASGAVPSEAFKSVVHAARADSELAEPAELLHLALARSWDDPDAAARPIAAGHGRVIHAPMRGGEALLEGATVHTLHDGRVQVIVYYRPRVDWMNRRLWLHAFRDGASGYLDPEPAIASSERPRAGDLEWTVFELPPGTYQGYVGIWVGTFLGDGSPIGPLP